MKYLSHLTALILLIGVFFQTEAQQALEKNKMDKLFEAISDNQKGMGCLTVSQNGQITYNKAIGYSQITADKKTPATTDTKYRVGSISKMFTATMIFQLIEEKKISLTTPLATFFPQMPNAQSITIDNLLNHSSGLHSFTDDDDYLSWAEKPQTQKQLLERISKATPDFQPNEKNSYSNANYILLGFIIEKAGKAPYSDALKKRIADKTGLKSTYYGGKINPAKDEAYSYEGDNFKAATETDMSVPHGAGAVVSTTNDLVKFIEALFSHKLINETSLQQMTTIKNGYGYGVFKFPFNGKYAYGHSGAIDGFASNLAYFPEEKVAVAYCSNYVVLPPNQIMIGVLSITFNEPYEIPTFKTIALSEKELAKYEGTYASPDFPLPVTIKIENKVLTAQATGQPSFPLDATEKNIFKFDPAGIVMEFNEEGKAFLLKQGGEEYTFTKE